jgi:hypothetical protein
VIVRVDVRFGGARGEECGDEHGEEPVDYVDLRTAAREQDDEDLVENVFGEVARKTLAVGGVYCPE